MTKQYLESVYSELCARLGDIVYKLEQLEKQRDDVKRQIEELNRSVSNYETFEHILRKQNGEKSKQEKTISKSLDVATSPQLLGTNNNESNN
jgi:prefoldin subunit 5